MTKKKADRSTGSAPSNCSGCLSDGPYLLELYPRCTALIRYRRPDGSIRDWFVGAVPGKDNEETLRKHLRRFTKSKKVEFIGWAIK